VFLSAISFQPMPVKLKTIYEMAAPYWDNDQVRPVARKSIRRAINCGEPVLGAAVYRSDDGEEKVVCNRCKSRACTRCGRRLTQLWLREQFCRLPDMPYLSVIFTMPDLFWEVFRLNRHLIKDLPAVGGAVIQQFLRQHYGVRALVVVIPHTFASKLNFNFHLHCCISSSCLDEQTGRRRIEIVQFKEEERKEIMALWRAAVVTYLRRALAASLLSPDTKLDMRELKYQSRREWVVLHRYLKSKVAFLNYAARYLRRPPIAECRIVSANQDGVEFEAKIREECKVENIKLSLKDFIAAIIDQVPDRYRHAVRYYGLLAPRAKSLAAVFFKLGQERRPRPERLTWADAIKKSFGIDPLLDSHGHRMKLVSRSFPDRGL